MTSRATATARGSRRGRALLAAIVLVVAGCQAPAHRLPRLPARVPHVRLLLVVVVDQLGWETLERFRPALRGGLARLLDQGVVFRQAYHRHAETSTAPGHATLATGLTPRHSGIVANEWYDRTMRRQVSAEQDPRTGMVGPMNLLVTGIGDWVRQRDPWGRSYSASGKGRSAVMLGGKRSDGAFWYDDEHGGFISSRAYPPLPLWVKRFNRQPALGDLFGALWRPLPLPPRVWPASLGVVQVQAPGMASGFPHAYGHAIAKRDADFYGGILVTPGVDGYLASFAHELVAHQRLGEDDHLDYLGLSFSAVDEVGHEYGPHSVELLDTVVRLDRTLGELLDFLEAKVGKDHLVVALSADHGVAPLPERQRRFGLPGVRESAGDIACVQSVSKKLDAAFGHRDWFAYHLYLDPVAVAASRVPRAQIDRSVVDWLTSCTNVARVWTRAQLQPDAPTRDPMQALYRASYQPARSGDYAVQWKPYFVERLEGTTHKSPYEYDTHVPIVLRVPGARARTIDAPVATVDLAPTLAGLLGLRPPTRLDGRDLSDWVLGQPAATPKPKR